MKWYWWALIILGILLIAFIIYGIKVKRVTEKTIATMQRIDAESYSRIDKECSNMFTSNHDRTICSVVWKDYYDKRMSQA